MATSPYEPPHSSEGRPTKIRHLVVAAATMTSVLLYLDRLCVAIAARFIRDDLGLSNQQIGFFLGAFFWTYALSQVPSGWFSDRFGARKMLTIYVLGWSLATGLLGVAWGFASLLVMRFLQGIAQAGAYPTCAALLSRWVPYTSRGVASSMVAAGGRMGAFLAPSLTGLLLVMLVSNSTPSKLTSEDILDPWTVCVKLDDAAVANNKNADEELPVTHEALVWLWDQMSPAAQSEISDQAEIARVAREAEKVAGKKEGSTPSQKPPEQLKDLLAGEFNNVLKTRDWYTAERFAGVEVESAATKIAELQNPTEEEVLRENRLLVEAVFPGSIRKVYRSGWRPVMMIYGLAGIVVAWLFWFGFRDEPRNHPWCNQAEVELIEHGRPPIKSKSKVGGVPVRAILTSPSIWMSCISQFGTNIGWVFLVTWLPTYLGEVHHLPTVQRAWMASIPMMLGWGGMLLGGPFTDVLARRLGLRWGRALPLALSRFVAMGAYVACLFEPSPWVAIGLFSLVAIATDFGVPAIWAFNQDVGGRHVGSILGFGNMCGNFGAAVAPSIMIFLVEGYSSKGSPNWTMAFVACAAAFLLSGVSGLFINASIPIAPDEDED